MCQFPSSVQSSESHASEQCSLQFLRGTRRSLSAARSVGRAAIGRIGQAVGSVGVGKLGAFALVAAVMCLANGQLMAQDAPVTPALPEFVDFAGLVDAIITGIQSYLGLVVVGIIALSLVTGFLAWTVGRRKLG